jgi:hypothetical protein
MRCTLPNQVADHAVISIGHPRIRCRYGGAHPTNKFVRISLGKRLPIWFPVEAIEFYARQFKRGSDARGHRCLAGTGRPDHHDSHLPLACSCKRGYPIARRELNVSAGPPRTKGAPPAASASSQSADLPAQQHTANASALKRDIKGPGYTKRMTVFVPRVAKPGASDELLRQIIDDKPHRFVAFAGKVKPTPDACSTTVDHEVLSGRGTRRHFTT